MRRYWTLAGLTAGAILATFLAARALHLPLLDDPSAWMGRGGAAAALLGVGLLTADVLLPVPSSAVMVLHGALFGVAAGTALSLAGSLGAALVAFGIGRAGERRIARFVSAEEHARAGRLLERWGMLAIVASRPVPILAETVMILAGASPLGWGRAALAAFLGSLAPAFLLALAGATAAGWGSATLVFGGVLAVSLLVWILGSSRREAPPRPGDVRAPGPRAGSAPPPA